MRRGHMKHLAQPKSGKGALKAHLRGHGAEVAKGRSIFKRTVNANQRLACRNVDVEKNHIAKQRTSFQKVIACDLQAFHDEEEHYDEDEQWGVESRWWGWHLPENPGVIDNCTASMNSAPVDLRSGDLPIQRTKKSAKSQTAFTRLADRLAVVGGVISASAFSKKQTEFHAFQWEFLEEFGVSCCESLQRCFPGSIGLTPVPLGEEVSKRFLEGKRSLRGQLRPAFHGTAETNLPSIFQRGLLIPGHGNELRVINGSVNGLGIYTAQVHNPSLSMGYSRGSKKLLICGVLDDAELGAYTGVEDIRHVGGAMVVFNEIRVAPLFQASLDGGEAPCMFKAASRFDWTRHLRLVRRVCDQYGKELIARLPLATRREKVIGPAAFARRRAAEKRRC